MITIRQGTDDQASRRGRPGVVFVINDLAMGGAERALITLANHLRSYRPVVVLIKPTLDLLDELEPAIPVYSLSAGGGARSAAGGERPPRGQPKGRMVLEVPGLLGLAHRLTRVAAEADCRLVSTFLNRSHTLGLTAKMLRPSLRVIVNVHEMLTDHLRIHFSAHERWLMRQFIRRRFPRADGIVTVAEGVRTDLETGFGIARERVTIVRNPIDRQRIRRLSREPAEAPFMNGRTVVGIGRLVELKGFDVLIRAVARLPVELGARLVLIGEGEARRGLEQLIAKLRVGDRVELIGEQQNPWPYLARARALAVPSRTEASPAVIGEAFALSVPVVAARCSPGVTEFLDNGRCGLLVPPDDVNALADALERLLTDDELVRSLIAAGARQLDALNIAETVRNYEAMLDTVSGADS
jgi:glycosyltransferase involved in cell wall biosynthesis